MAQHPEVAGDLAEPETAPKGEDDPLKCSDSEKSEQDENLPILQYSTLATCASLPPRQEETIHLSLDRKTCEVGRGTFGVVLKAKLGDGPMVALKKVRTDVHWNFRREVDVLISLDHCNVIKLLYFFEKSQEDLFRDATYPTLTMVLEFVPHTLLDLLEEHRSKGEWMPLVLVKVLLCQLFQALSYLYIRRIAHRDIKPKNILLNLESAVLKLGDFGLAKKLDRRPQISGCVGTCFYRAPEMLLGVKRYTCSVDVWSAGCVFAEMMSLKTPFFKAISGDQLETIAKVLGTPTASSFGVRDRLSDEANSRLRRLQFFPRRRLGQHFHGGITTDAIALLRKLLNYNPTTRLRPRMVIKHQFFHELRLPETLLPNGERLPPLGDEFRMRERGRADMKSQ